MFILVRLSRILLRALSRAPARKVNTGNVQVYQAAFQAVFLCGFSSSQMKAVPSTRFYDGQSLTAYLLTVYRTIQNFGGRKFWRNSSHQKLVDNTIDTIDYVTGI